MSKSCPDCSSPIAPGAASCLCGWEGRHAAQEGAGGDNHRCQYQTSQGARCWHPGGLQAGGRWFCREHHRSRGGAHADRIAWESAAAQATAPGHWADEAVAEIIRRGNEVLALGDKEARRATIAETPAAIREAVSIYVVMENNRRKARRDGQTYTAATALRAASQAAEALHCRNPTGAGHREVARDD